MPASCSIPPGRVGCVELECHDIGVPRQEAIPDLTVRSERLVALLGFLLATLLIASLWLFATHNPEPKRPPPKAATAHANPAVREKTYH